MRIPSILFLLFVFYLPFVKKSSVAAQPQGIDSEEGDAEMFYNRTYSQHQSALEAKIFRGYNPKVRPVKNETLPTIVDVHWHIIHVSINSKDQTMTVHGHIYMKWFDEKLVWEPKDFNGIHYARVKKWQVWQPKVKVANSASGLGSVFDFSTSAHVIIQMQDKGRAKVEMYPTFSIKVGCSFDFSNFPDDVNKCAMNLFATSPMSEVQLQNLYSIPPTLSFGWEEQKMKRIISDFKILNVSSDTYYYRAGNVSAQPPVTGDELAGTWSMLKVTVSFERHSPLFLSAVAAPCVLTGLIANAAFFLPTVPLAIYVLMCNTVIQMIFLLDMLKRLPNVAEDMPSALTLYMIVMIINGTSLIFHVFSMMLVNSKNQAPPFFRSIYVIKNYLPATWQEKNVIKDEEKLAIWPEWLQFARPVLGLVLAVILFVQIFVFLIL